MKTVHYAAGCDEGLATFWRSLVVEQEVTPPDFWELVDCHRTEADGWLGAETPCRPPESPGRVVAVYGEARTGAGSVSLRWGRRGEAGTILATYRFDAKLF